MQVVTWRTAYRALLPAAVLDDWDEAAAADAWRAAVASPADARARRPGGRGAATVVGFRRLRPGGADRGRAAAPGRPDDRDRRRCWSSRAGDAAGTAAGCSRPSPTSPGPAATARLQIWLPEEDPVSAGFFESAGWAPDGWARTLDTGGEPLREIRWHALLDEPTPRGAR